MLGLHSEKIEEETLIFYIDMEDMITQKKCILEVVSRVILLYEGKACVV